MRPATGSTASRPRCTRPYLRLARLDRPIGSWLLLMPCWWSAGLAAVQAGRLPSLWHIVLFFIGAFAMRGAGCTWNDLVDRDLDGLGRAHALAADPVRTGDASRRPPSSWWRRRWSGLLVLLQFNRFTVLCGIASLAVVAIYPFMKRITYWPQIVLGLAFSWGALMGWPAAFGRLDLAGAAALRRLDRLGDRLRHHLRASGPRGRRADRHQVDRAAVRRAHEADAGAVLCRARWC